MRGYSIVLLSVMTTAALLTERRVTDEVPSPPIDHQQSSSNVWFEYTVTGDVELTGREEDVVMCSNTDDGFQAQTLGEWTLRLEAEGDGPGTHHVQYELDVPQSVTALHDDDDRTNDRFYGDGSIAIEEAGKDQFGFTLVKIAFSADSLHADTEHTIAMKGTISCPLL